MRVICCLAFGLLAWSLAEYAVHRFVLHRWRRFRPGHMLHHRRPHAPVGVPFWLAGNCFAVAFWFAGSVGLGSAAFVAGFGVGYLAYVTIHEGLHNWRIEPGDWLYPIKRRHLLHHRGFAVNYGITSPLWDFIFGTS